MAYFPMIDGFDTAGSYMAAVMSAFDISAGSAVDLMFRSAEVPAFVSAVGSAVGSAGVTTAGTAGEKAADTIDTHNSCTADVTAVGTTVGMVV